MTKEQYAGSYRPKLMIFSATRDALNPQLNTESLRNRLWVIDHYKFRYGAAHTYWVHSALQKYFSHINKFRNNYAVKAFLAF